MTMPNIGTIRINGPHQPWAVHFGEREREKRVVWVSSDSIVPHDLVCNYLETFVVMINPFNNLNLL